MSSCSLKTIKGFPDIDSNFKTLSRDVCYLLSGGGIAGVSSVSGTSNRITSSGGGTPSIDISANYIGQSSITTLGTITTGTWNGTVISPSSGGTGVANAGTLTIGSNNVTLTTSGTTSLTLPESGTLATNEIDVFLIIGQSNGIGQGDSSLSPDPLPDTVYSFYNGVLGNGGDPIGPANTGSAWPALGIRYNSVTGRKICFAPACVGSSSMSPGGQDTGHRWDTGGTLYATSLVRLTNTLAAITAEGYTPIVKGIFFVLGEQDGSDINNSLSTASDFKTNFATMLANYRTDLSDSNLPLYIFRTGTNTGVSDTGYLAIRTAQEELAVEQSNVYIVYRNTIDFPSRGLLNGVVHYTQAGLNEMGTYGCEAILNRYNEVFEKVAPVRTTKASFRFDTTGTLLTTPQDGAVEAVSDILYYTGSTGTRRQLANLSSTQVFTGSNTFPGIALTGNTTFGTDNTYTIGSSGNQASAVWSAQFRYNGNLQVRTSNASNLIQFFQNAEVARFSANGNLLIGTTTDNSSTQKLQVTGAMNLTGLVYSNNTAITSNQVWGCNNAGTAMEGKTITGTSTVIDVTHGANSITLNIPDDAITQAKVANYSANTLWANNTGSAANPSSFTYKQVAEQVYAGTTTWNGTPPSGTTFVNYRWSQLGDEVTLMITAIYSVAGTSNSNVTFTLPSDMPNPAPPTGLTSASNKIYPGIGYIDANLTGMPGAGRALLFINPAGNGYEISVSATAVSARYVQAFIKYYV